jgi:hypothetical protein
MIRKMLAILVASGLATSQVHAVPPTGNELATGIHQVEEGDLDGAVISLDTAIQRLSKEAGREADLAQAYLYLGLAQLGLGQRERAKSSVRGALRANQQLTLDPKRFPPGLIQLADEVRREAVPVAAAPAPSPTPAPPAAATGTATKPAPEEKKKGGGSKAVLIGLGVAAVGGGIAAAAGGGGGSPQGTDQGGLAPASVTPEISLYSSSPSSGSSASLQLPANNVTRAISLAFTIKLNAADARAGDGTVLRVTLFQGSSTCLVNYPDTPAVTGNPSGSLYTVSGFQYYATFGTGSCSLPARVDRISASVVRGNTQIVSGSFATSITLNR